jgi:hypothetical protein
MDDGQRQQHAYHNHEQNHDHRCHDHDQHHPHQHLHPPQDNMSVTGEERLMQSFGAIAINKRRKIDHWSTHRAVRTSKHGLHFRFRIKLKTY